jgi:hypothetical protein
MSKCNGWTNEATWQVQLEVFSGLNAADTVGNMNAAEVANWAEEYACSIVKQNATGNARDWAMAYLSDVNWDEIAAHLVDAARGA